MPPGDLGWVDGRVRRFEVGRGPTSYWDPIGMRKDWVPGSGAPPSPMAYLLPLWPFGEAHRTWWSSLVRRGREPGPAGQCRGCGGAGARPGCLPGTCIPGARSGPWGRSGPEAPSPNPCPFRCTWYCGVGSDRPNMERWRAVVSSGSCPQGHVHRTLRGPGTGTGALGPRLLGPGRGAQRTLPRGWGRGLGGLPPPAAPSASLAFRPARPTQPSCVPVPTGSPGPARPPTPPTGHAHGLCPAERGR